MRGLTRKGRLGDQGAFGGINWGSWEQQGSCGGTLAASIPSVVASASACLWGSAHRLPAPGARLLSCVCLPALRSESLAKKRALRQASVASKEGAK